VPLPLLQLWMLLTELWMEGISAAPSFKPELSPLMQELPHSFPELPPLPQQQLWTLRME
jgi:hypothetical protein